MRDGLPHSACVLTMTKSSFGFGPALAFLPDPPRMRGNYLSCTHTVSVYALCIREVWDMMIDVSSVVCRVDASVGVGAE